MPQAKYNDQRWPIPDDSDPEDVRSSLETFFPEIANATYDVDDDTGDITFSVAAGTKGR